MYWWNSLRSKLVRRYAGRAQSLWKEQSLDSPIGHFVIGIRWVFRNKLDESGKVIRNKARLIAQRYNQQEGIGYDETFVSVARLKAIRMLLAFAAYKVFVLY